MAYDRDGGGDVSTTELGLVLRALGDHIDAQRLSDLVAMTDLNGSGAVDFEEFTGLMLRRQREIEHRGLRLAASTSIRPRHSRLDRGTQEAASQPPPPRHARTSVFNLLSIDFTSCEPISQF